MTVKSLSEDQKDHIVASFTTRTWLHGQSKSSAINELAILYDRHRRTIIRALEERKVDPGVKPRVKKVDRLDRSAVKVVIRTQTPWYRRLFQSVGQSLGLIG